MKICEWLAPAIMEFYLGKLEKGFIELRAKERQTYIRATVLVVPLAAIALVSKAAVTAF